MKITMIGPVYPYRGGIAQFTTSFCEELAASGHQMQVISFKRQYPAFLYPGQSDKDPSAVHDQVPALYILDPLYPWTWVTALQQVVSFKPDVVIIQWWTTFWAPAFFMLSAFLKRRGIARVFCIHNVVPHENRLIDIWLSRRVLAQGNAYITLSPKESQRLQEMLPGCTILQARLPVPKIQPVAMDRASIRNEMGISPETHVLLFFGIVRPYKGLKILIDAMGLLKDQHKPVLIIAGEFWEDEQQYREQINRLGLQDQVIIENRYIRNEELSRFFSAADVFVAPYTQGTQSAAIKMSMGYGLPILVSDQISSDLPLESYPFMLHQAGNADSLAKSLHIFLTQGYASPGYVSCDDDWPYMMKLIDQLRDHLRENLTERK